MIPFSIWHNISAPWWPAWCFVSRRVACAIFDMRGLHATCPVLMPVCHTSVLQLELQFAWHCIFSLLCCSKTSSVVAQPSSEELQPCDCLANGFMSADIITSHGWNSTYLQGGLCFPLELLFRQQRIRIWICPAWVAACVGLEGKLRSYGYNFAAVMFM